MAHPQFGDERFIIIKNILQALDESSQEILNLIEDGDSIDIPSVDKLYDLINPRLKPSRLEEYYGSLYLFPNGETLQN